VSTAAGTTEMTNKGVAGAPSSRYLTFALGIEEYGIEILKVREIIQYVEVTPVPLAPAHVDGVINLRGQIIPVVNLRQKFGMPKVEKTDQTCIIVVEMASNGRKLNIGVAVDQVTEVLTMTADQIDPPPAFDTSVTGDFILGIGKIGKAVKILLNIDAVLTVDGDVGLSDVHKQIVAGDQ
jgi:purine-binding chemotaxis protein CheW